MNIQRANIYIGMSVCLSDAPCHAHMQGMFTRSFNHNHVHTHIHAPPTSRITHTLSHTHFHSLTHTHTYTHSLTHTHTHTHPGLLVLSSAREWLRDVRAKRCLYFCFYFNFKKELSFKIFC